MILLVKLYSFMKTFQQYLIEQDLNEGVISNAIKSLWKLTTGRYSRADYDRALDAAQVVVNSPEAIESSINLIMLLKHMGLAVGLGLGGVETPKVTSNTPVMTRATNDFETNPIDLGRMVGHNQDSRAASAFHTAGFASARRNRS
jgi:hypothetical protein